MAPPKLNNESTFEKKPKTFVFFKSQLKTESKKLRHDSFKIPKSSASFYTNKNSYCGGGQGALHQSANFTYFFFLFCSFLSFGYELKPIPSLQVETMWWEGGAKGTTKSHRSSSKPALHALERAMEKQRRKKKKIETQRRMRTDELMKRRSHPL